MRELEQSSPAEIGDGWSFRSCGSSGSQGLTSSGTGVDPFRLLHRRISDSHAKELGLHDIQVIYEIAGDVSPHDFPLD